MPLVPDRNGQTPIVIDTRQHWPSARKAMEAERRVDSGLLHVYEKGKNGWELSELWENTSLPKARSLLEHPDLIGIWWSQDHVAPVMLFKDLEKYEEFKALNIVDTRAPPRKPHSKVSVPTQNRMSNEGLWR